MWMKRTVLWDASVRLRYYYEWYVEQMDVNKCDGTIVLWKLESGMKEAYCGIKCPSFKHPEIRWVRFVLSPQWKKTGGLKIRWNQHY